MGPNDAFAALLIICISFPSGEVFFLRFVLIFNVMKRRDADVNQIPSLSSLSFILSLRRISRARQMTNQTRSDLFAFFLSRGGQRSSRDHTSSGANPLVLFIGARAGRV